MPSRFLLKFFLIITSMQSQAFVHVSADKPRLPSSLNDPEVLFYWDGSLPSIKDKGEFEGGVYQELEDSEFFLALLRLAFQKWNEVDGSYLVMTPILDPTASIDGDDSRNSIVVKSIDSLSAAAFAQPFNRSTKNESDQSEAESDTNTIHDCDISVSKKSVKAKELFSTLVHEIGHCIGLGHPHTNYHSIMSYARPSGTNRLGLDDMAGIIFLYPEDEQDVKEIVPCGSIGRLNLNDKVAIALMLSPLVLVWLEQKRRIL